MLRRERVDDVLMDELSVAQRERVRAQLVVRIDVRAHSPRV